MRLSGNPVWKSKTLVTPTWGYLHLVVFSVILGSIGAVVSKWLLTQKRLAVGRNGLKFWTQAHWKHRLVYS